MDTKKLVGERMKWIKSGGGPLIVLEQSLARHWRGVEGNSAIGDARNAFANDYARACAISDYVGEVEVGSGSALILGDEPLQTYVWIREDKNINIVRVYLRMWA